MDIWSLLQIVFNVFFAVMLGVLWLRFRRPPKEDPRLSRGLQLLQSKLAVLEDLSDRTDNQVKQLTDLIDQKTKSVKELLLEVESHLEKVDSSRKKSIEVAKIFEDKIPHEEIIDRQMRRKYLQASQLLVQGHSTQDVSKRLDLPHGEVEVLAQLGQSGLNQFEKEIREELDSSNSDIQNLNIKYELQNQTDFSDQHTNHSSDAVFDKVPFSTESIDKLTQEFKEACRESAENEENSSGSIMKRIDGLENFAEKLLHKFTDSKIVEKTAQFIESNNSFEEPKNVTQEENKNLNEKASESSNEKVKPFEFKEIDSNQNLG